MNEMYNLKQFLKAFHASTQFMGFVVLKNFNFQTASFQKFVKFHN